MKAWLVSIAVLGSSSAIMAAQPPILVPAPVERVFVPMGFDDNDNTEVIVHGHFPSSCYKTGPVQVTVNEATRAIELQAQAYYYENEACNLMIIPYSVSVKMGTLTKGNYRLTVRSNGNINPPPLSIAEATSTSPDDYLYAPVEYARLDVDPETSEQKIVLEGTYPHMLVGCMVITDVRSYMSPGNTYVVLPISTIVDGPACDAQAATKKYSYSVPLPSAPLPRGDAMLHVRSLNGNAVNQFVEVAGQ